MPEHRRIGMDLEPKCDGVKLQDFLKTLKIEFKSHNTVVVGNPPFGKRGHCKQKRLFFYKLYLCEKLREKSEML